MDWKQRRARRERLRFIQLSGQLIHRVVVPPGPDGRPGEWLMTPSLNQYASQISIDGARSDLAIVLSPGGSRLAAICLGTTGDRGTPMESAEKSIFELDRRRHGRCIENPSETRMAGCDAVTYVILRPNGETLREWKFTQEGWLFVAGILRRPGDRPWVESFGLKSLDTWEWIPGTPSSIVPQRTIDAVTGVTEITESIVTAAPVATVWALIRQVENNRLLHENFVDAFRVPDTPDGIGEEQSVVLQFPGYRRTVTSILVEEIPFEKLVTQMRGLNDPFNQEVFILAAESDRTRLTVSAKYSVALDAGVRERQAELTRAALHNYLARVEQVLAGGWTEQSGD